MYTPVTDGYLCLILITTHEGQTRRFPFPKNPCRGQYKLPICSFTKGSGAVVLTVISYVTGISDTELEDIWGLSILLQNVHIMIYTFSICSICSLFLEALGYNLSRHTMKGQLQDFLLSLDDLFHLYPLSHH